MAKPALGRGLGALLGGSPPARPAAQAPFSAQVTPAAPHTEQSAVGAESVRRVAVTQVKPCPFQPRKDFSEESLQELAASIKDQGIVQPLIVREREGGGFELIAGERRWRAAQIVGLTEVPVLVRKADDREVLELALIENLQRENLNPMEEAQGYAQLVDLFELTQEEAALKVGKSRVVVTNSMRLLKLPVPVQEHLRHNRLSVGHAKALLGLTDSKMQLNVAEKLVNDGLSVRQTEALVGRLQQTRPPGGAVGDSERKDLHVSAMEDRIRERLGTRVKLRYAEGKGVLEIGFFSDDELERILTVLGVPAQ